MKDVFEGFEAEIPEITQYTFSLCWLLYDTWYSRVSGRKSSCNKLNVPQKRYPFAAESWQWIIYHTFPVIEGEWDVNRILICGLQNEGAKDRPHHCES